MRYDSITDIPPPIPGLPAVPADRVRDICDRFIARGLATITPDGNVVITAAGVDAARARRALGTR